MKIVNFYGKLREKRLKQKYNKCKKNGNKWIALAS